MEDQKIFKKQNMRKNQNKNLKFTRCLSHINGNFKIFFNLKSRQINGLEACESKRNTKSIIRGSFSIRNKHKNKKLTIKKCKLSFSTKNLRSELFDYKKYQGNEKPDTYKLIHFKGIKIFTDHLIIFAVKFYFLRSDLEEKVYHKLKLYQKKFKLKITNEIIFYFGINKKRCTHYNTNWNFLNEFHIYSIYVRMLFGFVFRPYIIEKNRAHFRRIRKYYKLIYRKSAPVYSETKNYNKTRSANYVTHINSWGFKNISFRNYKFCVYAYNMLYLRNSYFFTNIVYRSHMKGCFRINFFIMTLKTHIRTISDCFKYIKYKSSNYFHESLPYMAVIVTDISYYSVILRQHPIFILIKKQIWFSILTKQKVELSFQGLHKIATLLKENSSDLFFIGFVKNIFENKKTLGILLTGSFKEVCLVTINQIKTKKQNDTNLSVTEMIYSRYRQNTDFHKIHLDFSVFNKLEQTKNMAIGVFIVFINKIAIGKLTIRKFQQKNPKLGKLIIRKLQLSILQKHFVTSKSFDTNLSSFAHFDLEFFSNNSKGHYRKKIKYSCFFITNFKQNPFIPFSYTDTKKIVYYKDLFLFCILRNLQLQQPNIHYVQNYLSVFLHIINLFANLNNLWGHRFSTSLTKMNKNYTSNQKMCLIENIQGNFAGWNILRWFVKEIDHQFEHVSKLKTNNHEFVSYQHKVKFGFSRFSTFLKGGGKKFQNQSVKKISTDHESSNKEKMIENIDLLLNNILALEKEDENLLKEQSKTKIRDSENLRDEINLENECTDFEDNNNKEHFVKNNSLESKADKIFDEKYFDKNLSKEAQNILSKLNSHLKSKNNNFLFRNLNVSATIPENILYKNYEKVLDFENKNTELKHQKPDKCIKQKKEKITDLDLMCMRNSKLKLNIGKSWNKESQKLSHSNSYTVKLNINAANDFCANLTKNNVMSKMDQFYKKNYSPENLKNKKEFRTHDDMRYLGDMDLAGKESKHESIEDKMHVLNPQSNKKCIQNKSRECFNIEKSPKIIQKDLQMSSYKEKTSFRGSFDSKTNTSFLKSDKKIIDYDSILTEYLQNIDFSNNIRDFPKKYLNQEFCDKNLRNYEFCRGSFFKEKNNFLHHASPKYHENAEGYYPNPDPLPYSQVNHQSSFQSHFYIQNKKLKKNFFPKQESKIQNFQTNRDYQNFTNLEWDACVALLRIAQDKSAFFVNDIHLPNIDSDTDNYDHLHDSRARYREILKNLTHAYDCVIDQNIHMLDIQQHDAIRKVIIKLQLLSQEAEKIYHNIHRNHRSVVKTSALEKIRRKAIGFGFKALMQLNPFCKLKSQKIVTFESLKYILHLQIENDILKKSLEGDPENS